jgi:hypothetical protein
MMKQKTQKRSPDNIYTPVVMMVFMHSIFIAADCSGALVLCITLSPSKVFICTFFFS